MRTPRQKQQLPMPNFLMMTSQVPQQIIICQILFEADSSDNKSDDDGDDSDDDSNDLTGVPVSTLQLRDDLPQ